MLTNSRIVLSLALVVATFSAAAAAPRQAARHQTPISQEVPAGSHLTLDSTRPTEPARSSRSANASSNLSPLEFERLARLIEAMDEIGTKTDLGN
ncbi:MAG TPA: hypothetical protein VH684_09285 [Xanthobacteraceae bacterium]|jgi:hypothetical protein